jgi:hypothetical protein
LSICIAIPFEPTPLDKLATIVTKCCEHRPWFSDFDWEQGEAHRRAMVIARLSNLSSRTWEVYREGEIVGLLHADEITPRVDAHCHFIFFDHELKDKRQLCLVTMQWLFDKYDLHALRAEIPTYAYKLAKFARNALYLKFESESRSFSWPANAAPIDADAAKLGSRRHQATFYEGKWHDILLLSITADEFRAIDKDSVDRPTAVPAQTD